MNLTDYFCTTNSSYYNYSDDVTNTDIKTENLLSSSTILLLFGVLFALILNKFIEFKRKATGNKRNGSIPIFSPFPLPMGFRLPTIVETVILAAQIKREGLKLSEKVYQKYIDEPIIKIPVLTNHVLQIKCPLLIQKILGSSNPHVLNKPQQHYRHVFPDEYKNGLATSSLEVWAPHRKVLNKCWNYGAILAYLGIMNRHGKNFIKDLLDRVSRNPLNSLDAPFIYDKLYFHALNIISEILMGEGNFTEEENESFHTNLLGYHSMTVYRILNPLNLLPFIWWLNPKQKISKEHVSELRKHVEKAIQRVKEDIQKNKKAQTYNGDDDAKRMRSMIEELILNNIPEDEIKIEIFTFFVVGHETTVAAIKYSLQHIAENPNVQRLCQEELDFVFELKRRSSLTDSSDSFEDFTVDDLANLKYLERCILETLRITPILPALSRQLSSPMEINGYKFKKDSVISVPIWGIHRDPRIYPNPGKFDPDRFLPENIAKRSTYTFLPFSHGPRNCIGYKAAMMEMKIILGMLLRHFNVSTKDRFEDVPIRFEVKTSPERDYNVALTKREK